MSKPSITKEKDSVEALLRERGEVLRRVGQIVLAEARFQALLAKERGA